MSRLRVISYTTCPVSQDRQLKSYDFDSGQEETLVQLRRNTYPPLSLSYCPSEGMALFYYDNDGGTFELYSIPKNGTNADDVKKGFYTAAVFFSRRCHEGGISVANIQDLGPI